MLGRQTKHYALNQLERVEVRRYWDSDEGESFYLLTLVFEGHAPLVLWEDWNAQAGEKVVAVIQRFLDRQEMSHVE